MCNQLERKRFPYNCTRVFVAFLAVLKGTYHKTTAEGFFFEKHSAELLFCRVMVCGHRTGDCWLSQKVMKIQVLGVLKFYIRATESQMSWKTESAGTADD